MSIVIPNSILPPDDKMDLVLCIQHDGTILTPRGTVCGKAIELPPHGRLIDADALMAEFEQMQKLNETRGHEFACSFMSSSMEISTEWYCVEDAVNAAPTIIPAEGGADG